ncbi:KRAB-A domain-containing protein 2-like [Photinus pyralis]|uniref:KRAB-A domain-containing protein 2-like n=1 Tax=Photinus pyralis TaxID=7054 RepID=UPI0012673371|nr:KRAB-A domain-containing protein 2-like [Photinus pyralis]
MEEDSVNGGHSQKEWRERFMTTVLQSENDKSTHFNVLTKDKYQQLINEVETAANTDKKTPLQQRRLKRFSVIDIGGVKKLVAARERNENIKYYLTVDELYDVIDAAHVAVGHGGRDRMLAETSKKYANITKEEIQLYLSMCQVCHMKKNKKKQGLVSKPILHSEMNSRCQVDLIDFQTQPDDKFKFIMVYQDHLTTFVLLRPLQSKRAEEVAYQLNDIFLTLGAPCILQSDNGREFVNKVISEVTQLWPELKIVHGKPRHSQSQGSVERANQDIENMLASWMADNKTTKWSEGLRYVQFMKNRAFHSGIKQSPYKAMFGMDPRVGLSTSSLPSEIFKDINDEEDLTKVINNNLTPASETADDILMEEDENMVQAHTSTDNQIKHSRKTAAEGLRKQAKKMKSHSDKSHPPANIGDNVMIPIPDVDKSKVDLRNIIGVVIDITDEGLYKVGTKHGILQTLYCRTQFDVSAQRFITENDVNMETVKDF